MSDELINQTEFTQKAHAAAVDPVAQPVPVDKPKTRKNTFIAIGILLVVVLALISSVVYVSLTSKKETAIVATPTPAPSEPPIETQGIRSEIAPFLKTIDESNPEADEHPFPPVRFDLRIKDPNTR